MPGCRIHKLVYSGKKETILRACFVQVREIHAHSPLPICLFYKDDVSEPVRIVDFADEAYCQQLGDFICDYLVSFWGEDSSSLLDRLSFWVHIQLMLNDFWSYARHVLVAPSENI